MQPTGCMSLHYAANRLPVKSPDAPLAPRAGAIAPVGGPSR